jgi:cation transport regulator ChaC
LPDPGSRYFAYGSNMDPVQMEYRGLEVLTAGPARLHGYRLAFSFDASSRWLGGAADIVQEEGAVVEGVLYDLGNDIEVMDPWEGAPDWYRRIAVTVETSDGTVPAWTYEVVDKLPYQAPSEGYIGKMILAARQHGLSPGYVDSLRLHLACALRGLGDHERVLRSIQGSDGNARTAEVASSTGLAPGSVTRVLEDLLCWGWLEGGPEQGYMVPLDRSEDVERLLG